MGDIVVGDVDERALNQCEKALLLNLTRRRRAKYKTIFEDMEVERAKQCARDLVSGAGEKVLATVSWPDGDPVEADLDVRRGNVYVERSWERLANGDLRIDLTKFPLDVITRIEVVHDSGVRPLEGVDAELVPLAEAVSVRASKVDIWYPGQFPTTLLPCFHKYGPIELYLEASRATDKMGLEAFSRTRVRFVGAVAKDIYPAIPSPLDGIAVNPQSWPALRVPWLRAGSGYICLQWVMSELDREDLKVAIDALSPLSPRIKIREASVTGTKD